MRNKYWDAEEQYLADNWQRKSHLEMASALGRTEKGIRNHLWRLKLVDRSDDWTPAQLDGLKQIYADSNYKNHLSDYAKAIGKNKSNVCRKAKELGLHTQYGRSNPKQISACSHCGRFYEMQRKGQKFCSRGCSTVGRLPKERGNHFWGVCGKRPDLNNIFFRSRLEANYARYLNFLIEQGTYQKWEFEVDTFWFEKIKRGVRSYTPDFKVYLPDGAIEYHEVKGYDYPRGKTARKRLAKYYPHIKLIFVDRDFFKELKRKGFDKLLPNWEKSS